MKKIKAKFRIIIERTEYGFSAYSSNYNICTTGQTIAELQVNILEAFNLYFENEGTYVSNSNLEMRIDFKQFFQFYRVLNAKYLADRIGMNPSLLSQYVQGKKIPSAAQTNKIILGINQIGEELCALKF